MKLTHEEAKKLTFLYRKRAVEIYQNGDNKISINLNGGLEIVEDGAFVEAMIWIPKAEINE